MPLTQFKIFEAGSCVFKRIGTSLMAAGISVASLGAIYSPTTVAAAIPWFQVYAPTTTQAAGTDLAISYAQNPAGPPTFQGFPEYQVRVKPPRKAMGYDSELQSRHLHRSGRNTCRH